MFDVPALSLPAPAAIPGLVPSGAGQQAEADTLYALDWDGNPSGRRMLRFGTPPAAYPMTYLFKVYQRDQVTGVGDNTRYYTTFFHGNDGRFAWDLGEGDTYFQSYYGAHPYPSPTNEGDGKWEISNDGSDIVTRDDASSPFVVNDAWYSQAFVANDAGGDLFHRFYINLPDVTTEWRITFTKSSTSYVEPPTPIICFGQAPDFTGNSWGGYSRWEEQNARIRGIMIFDVVVSEEHIVELSQLETDAEVLAYCAANSLPAPWYLNMNPRPSDVSDKSGNGNNPTIVSTNGETIEEWSEAA